VQQDPGFTATTRGSRHGSSCRISYADFTKIVDFYDRLLTSVRAQPGRVGRRRQQFPAARGGPGRGPFFIQGAAASALRLTRRRRSIRRSTTTISARLGVPLIKGRFFNANDNAQAPGVIIVNDALARPSVARRGSGRPDGDVADHGHRADGTLADEAAAVPGRRRRRQRERTRHSCATPSRRSISASGSFPFRGPQTSSCQGQGRCGRRCSARSGRRCSASIRTCRWRRLGRSIGSSARRTDRPARALMMLMGIFAALALVLSALGIYSVLSYSVNQRRQELSVRMALGAQPSDVLWLVVRQGLWLALMGGVAGARRARFAVGARDVEPALRRVLRRRGGVRRGDRPGAHHRPSRRACCRRARAGRPRSARRIAGGLEDRDRDRGFRVQGSFWVLGSRFCRGSSNPEP